MPTVKTQIDIAASPAEVRKTQSDIFAYAQFFDFEKYEAWAKKHLIGVAVTSGDKTDLKPGDKLKVSLTGISFPATVVVNTPEEFQWCGSIPYIFTGYHSFRFLPSEETPGHTTLVQQEEFSGMLSFLVGPTWSGGKETTANFEGFNGELKARVEGSQE
ncbi:MAG: hypothetical protein M1828_006004 [Chrysothrix sp. TS-e1954]|nr:MAG: hypothetical protein M1828_006004 [Chrysothrix sp. TS-e1954]